MPDIIDHSIHATFTHWMAAFKTNLGLSSVAAMVLLSGLIVGSGFLLFLAVR